MFISEIKEIYEFFELRTNPITTLYRLHNIALTIFVAVSINTKHCTEIICSFFRFFRC